MNVEKVIRILGYIVYTALWSPVIVVITPIAFVAFMVMAKRLGMTTREGLKMTGQSFKAGIQHDMHFIKTGVW